MSYAKTIVRRPVAILVAFLTLAGLGIFALPRIPVDLFPEVEPPVLLIRTTYDAGPAEVEETVTAPLEALLGNVGGLDRISSTSSEGFSQIVMEFLWDIDLTEATNDVRDQLERAAIVLPDEADAPQIFKFDPSLQPIMTIAVSGNRSTDALRVIAEDEVASELEKLDGVAEANVDGGREAEVRVELIQSALEAYGLTVNGVAATLSRQNVDVTGGQLPFGDQDLLVRSVGEFASLQDIDATVVGYVSDPLAGANARPRPVRLDEIADVAFTFGDPASLVFVDGVPAVTISVQKTSGTNTVQVAEQVREVLAEVAPALPAGVTTSVTDDTSTAVRSVLDQVTGSLLWGAMLGMVVLLIFLRNLRAAIIIGASIPVSVLVTFAALYFGGRTLNLLTMSGLVIAIGMIVDSSIVVLEHIYSFRSKGMPLAEAAMRGTSEMIAPITASALTTASVFLPLLLFRRDLEILGIIFGDIAFVVIVAILASLIVAAALVPVLSTAYLPIRIPGEAQRPARIKLIGRLRAARQRSAAARVLARVNDWFERGFTALENGYARAVAAVLRNRMVTLSTTIALLILAVSVVPRLGFVFAPPSAEDVVSTSVQFRQGESLDRVAAAVVPVANALQEELPELLSVVVNVGSRGRARVIATLPPIGEREIDADDVSTRLRAMLDEVPGAASAFGQNRGQALSGANPISVTLQSDDIDAALATAREIRDMLESDFPQVTEAEVSVQESAPELQVVIDRIRAADLGVSITDVSSEVRAAVDGVTATRYEDAGTEYNVLVVLRDEDRDEVPDLERIFVRNSVGDRVPLASVATLEYSVGPVSIARENELRTVQVTAGLQPGLQISEVQPEVEAAIAETIVVPPQVDLDYTGELSALQDATAAIVPVMAVAVLLVFAIMAGQFESFVMPFIIFFTIPLLVVGVVWIYFLMGQPLSVFSLVGVVVLIGIVVNNGIVLVDYINLLRRRGTPASEAIVEAARTRLRPILMTTLTTVLGLVPLAFFAGEGAQLTQPVALTGVGGLVSSSILTLFVIPALYSLVGAHSKVRLNEDVAAERSATVA